ncbi:MAG: hypothetical protein MUE97_07180 [Phycisphaerales bacterium]|jgi:hypothetical protein|nr:hypothetical protein [Phycisphaerales bacterium]
MPAHARHIAIALALAALAPISSHAQTVIYSNSGQLGDPGLGGASQTRSGLAAPAGTRWSEVAALGTGPTATASNAVAGFAGFAVPEVSGAHYRFADDFTLPPGSRWRISGARFYVYFAHPTIASPAPSITAANLRIWSGQPGSSGSTILFGDEQTDRLRTIVATDLRRIFSTATVADAPAAIEPTATRIIYQVTLTWPQLTLTAPPAAGTPQTFWLDWQFTPDAAADTQIFAPALTIAGQRSSPGANALQFRLAPPPVLADRWLPLADSGKPASAGSVAQDLPFELLGEIVSLACGPSDVAGANQTVGADGSLSADDIIVFLSWYFAADPRADIAGTNQSSTPDSAFTADDIIVFLGRYFAGC